MKDNDSISVSNQEAAQAHHIRLAPVEKGVHLRLRELWEYRDLVRLLTRKTFSMTYQQTILGPLWIVFNPLLSSLLYMFLFGYVANIGTSGIPSILFYFLCRVGSAFSKPCFECQHLCGKCEPFREGVFPTPDGANLQYDCGFAEVLCAVNYYCGNYGCVCCKR